MPLHQLLNTGKHSNKTQTNHETYTRTYCHTITPPTTITQFRYSAHDLVILLLNMKLINIDDIVYIIAYCISWGNERVKHMARAINLAIITAMLVLITLIASSMYPVYVHAITYADEVGWVLDNATISYIKNMTRLPPDMPSLDKYREFAKRFYTGTCYTYKEVFRGFSTSVYEKEPVDIDMVVFLIYPTVEHYGRVGYWLDFVLVYDPMTRRFLWAYLNSSGVYGYFTIDINDVLAYTLSKGFPPAGFFLWYVKVDENAWRNGWFVISAWYYRHNATHVHNIECMQNKYPCWAYCPAPENFTWGMLFEPVTVTTTFTLPVTVTETSTLTTALPPATITSMVTTTTPITIEKTATATSVSPTTIEKTVTSIETLTIERTAIMSYTMTLPVTTTATVEKQVTIEKTATQVVKELDTMSLMIATGLAIAMGVAIGFMVRRR